MANLQTTEEKHSPDDPFDNWSLARIRRAELIAKRVAIDHLIGLPEEKRREIIDASNEEPLDKADALAFIRFERKGPGSYRIEDPPPRYLTNGQHSDVLIRAYRAKIGKS